MMKKTTVALVCILLVVLISGCVSNEAPGNIPSNKGISANSYDGKKVLFIDSYHEGYEWGDGEVNGAKRVLIGTGVELKIIHMDTKRNDSDAFGKQAGLKAKSVIEEFKPDVVIIADDPAFKYVLKPYYRNAGIPFVYAGINWDASGYGAPYNNTAGMLEVGMTPQLLSYLKEYARGDRVGFIAGNTTTDRKNADYHAKLFNITFTKTYHVETFGQWKEAFLSLQNDVDIILFENNAGIEDWNGLEAESFVLNNTKVPAGTMQPHITPYVLIGFTKIPEEQGEWAANAVLRILSGTKPSDIPRAANQKGRLYANMKIADTLGVTINQYFMSNAELIR